MALQLRGPSAPIYAAPATEPDRAARTPTLRTVGGVNQRRDVLSVAAAELGEAGTVQLRMRGDALAPVLRDGAVATLAATSVHERRVSPGDVVLAQVGGRWVLRAVLVWGPGRTSVYLGANGGRLTGWADLAAVAGVVTVVDGRRPSRFRTPRRRR